jgi:hypothetical protein
MNRGRKFLVKSISSIFAVHPAPAFFVKPGGFFLSLHQIKISNFMLEKTILNLIFQKPIFNIFATNMKVGEREGVLHLPG